MDKRYKMILSNKKLFKEIELLPDTKSLTIGTTRNCSVRFSKEYFFSDFAFTLEQAEETWSISCDEHIYFSLDGVMKLVHKKLSHGDSLWIKYQDSNQEVFKISYVLDFDFDNKEYTRIIHIDDTPEICIGGAVSCQIRIDDPLIGGDFLTLYKESGRFSIRDNATKYGVYVNGARIDGTAPVDDYDFFSTAGYSFYYKYGKLYTSPQAKIIGLSFEDVPESKSQLTYPRFNRSTRVKPVVPKEKIPVLAPPAEPERPRGNVVMQLFPVLGMMAVTVLLRGMMGGSGGGFIIFSACSMGIGVIASAASIIMERKKYRKDTVSRKEKYLRYIADKKEYLNESRREELAVLDELYYSSTCILKMVDDFSVELFNRNPNDEDFLCVRIGTGSVLSNRPIDYKTQEKFEASDELANIPEQLAFSYQYITGGPIVLDLKSNYAVGIVGDSEKLNDLLKIITMDLCTRQYFSDVKLFYILDAEQSGQIAGFRLLPHVLNDDLGIRNIVCDDESKNMLFEYLYREISRRETSKTTLPRIVVFVLNDLGMKKHPISNYIKNANEYGVTFIFMENHQELLPNGCTAIVSLSGPDAQGAVTTCADSTKVLQFSYDSVTDNTLSSVVARLAPVFCEEVSLEGTLTKNISLFELLGILSVDDIDLSENWAAAQVYQSMAAPLGVKSKNEIITLDINEKHHGPHGLVAGTTGSGKSELLQSYILSMAATFHPYEVGFVIIDFKGGGMVNQFKDLPHLIGSITNIDGREINRSLLSIKAELKKRQTLFAQSGVNHIDSYIKLYKKGAVQIPLPHLILIVDEFAELKMDQPEFMKELISAARIGRSLGVHLILATQKPSGVIDTQIWSNSKFRLCLKVQNKEDSNEVLKTPLAAEIKEPGRAYLQVGNNEVFELFQSAYSGAPAILDDSAARKQYELCCVSLSGRREPFFSKKPERSPDQLDTQLMAIVSYINSYCTDNKIKKLPGICLPPLEDSVSYPRSGKVHSSKIRTMIPLGILDDPDRQLQQAARLDLTSGNTMIIGSSQYGKTNLLQTIIRGISDNYTPEEVTLYILDFGSMALKVFEGLNHVGGVVVASDDEKMKNFIRMILSEIKDRKNILSQIGITSYVSYREAGHTDLPHIVVLVDNFIAARELYPDYEEEYLYICREGTALGLSMVYTSLQTSGINYRYMSNFPNRICLYCNQSDEYGTLFDRCRMEPKKVPGRGLISIDKNVYEFQTYLAFDGEKEIDRVTAIKDYTAQVNQVYDSRARQIPEVPQRLDLDYMEKYAASLRPYQIPFGIDYDTVDSVTIDMLKTCAIGIMGREGSGKSNIIRVCMRYFQQHGDLPVEAYLVDDYDKQLSAYASWGFAKTYTNTANDLLDILREMESELRKRQKMIQSDGAEAIASLPLLLCVVQNSSLFMPGDANNETADILRRMIESYRQLRFCIFFGNIPNTNVSYSSPELLKICRDFSHIFVCDDLSNTKLVEISAADMRRCKKPIELGDAYLIGENEARKLKIAHAVVQED